MFAPLGSRGRARILPAGSPPGYPPGRKGGRVSRPPPPPGEGGPASRPPPPRASGSAPLSRRRLPSAALAVAAGQTLHAPLRELEVARALGTGAKERVARVVGIQHGLRLPAGGGTSRR